MGLLKHRDLMGERDSIVKFHIFGDEIYREIIWIFGINFEED